jgi:ferredoxin-NADP reductase
MSMLRHREAKGAPVVTGVLLSSRRPDDVLYRDELERLEPRDGLRIERTYTRAAPARWTGWRRRVDAAMVAEISPGADARCFVCGPTPFVEVVNDLLVADGHHASLVRAERFGGSPG